MAEDAPQRDEPVVAIDLIDGAAVVRLAGELDLYNAEKVRTALGGAAAGDPVRVVIDLSAVEFIDSTALGALVDAHRRQPGGLRIASPQDAIRRALHVSGIDRHLAVFDTVDDALTG